MSGQQKFRKNLLLEGIPGCGKSTAIYNGLKELGLADICGGFHTVRIFGKTGKIRGFAQLPASEESEVNIFTDAAVPRMFLDFSGIPPLQKHVFLDFTIKSLQEKTELLLMDEIGGRELDIPEVRSAFLEALKGPVPVIGVLKCPDHAKHFSFDTYLDFRRELEEKTDTEIREMCVKNREETGIYIADWLRARGSAVHEAFVRENSQPL